MVRVNIRFERIIFKVKNNEYTFTVSAALYPDGWLISDIKGQFAPIKNTRIHDLKIHTCVGAQLTRW